MMLAYQDPESRMTLKEAIFELRKAENVEIYLPEDLSTEMREAIEAHDAIHTIFACDVSEKDEVVAHVWMLLGTTISLEDMKRAAKSREHLKMASDSGHLKMVSALVRALPDVGKAVFSALRMKKRFPWMGYREYLGKSLFDIRQEFGIRV